MSYQITEEQKKALLQYSAQTLPDNPSRDGFSAESIRKRMYKPTEKLIDLVNSVFDTAYTDVQSVLTDIQNGNLFARSFVSWSASYTYGADEITFYPSIGTYGAFVQSVVAGNTNNAPYINGALNSAYWSEVVNFNTVTDDFFAEIKAVQIAAEAAQSAAETAQGKAEDAQAAAEEAESGAQTQAQAAASSATAAATSANRAQEIVNGIGSVYKPVGSIAFSALPAAPAAAQQGYVYNITDAFTTDARFVEGAGKEYPAGTNVAVVLNGSAYMYDALSGNVDLSNYAQTNGTYSGMTVGNATQAQNAATADSATSAQDSAKLGGVAASEYAQIAQIANNIISVETLPTATADSPDFVQTPDGKLYRKKSSQTNGIDTTKLQGTWKIKPTSNVSGLTNFNTEMKVNVSAVAHAFDEDLFGFIFSGQTFSTFNYYVEPFTLCDNGTWQIRDDIEFYAAADNLSYKTELLAMMNQCYTKQTSSIITTYSYEEVGGTEVVANPTATGTQDLTSLQVGETVYNIPQGSGGITNAEVIEYADELPTATETSPNFVQTPDGTLYRKKAVEGGSLLGTWVFNDNPVVSEDLVANISFTSNGNSYNKLDVRLLFGPNFEILYNETIVCDQTGFNDPADKTIQITDISALTNVNDFTQWLTANATKQGGGASVSYEYVAMQEVPTPTTADNGKVLGVTNGAYALQESSGGGSTKKLYRHIIVTDEFEARGVNLYIVSSDSEAYGGFMSFFNTCIATNYVNIDHDSSVPVSISGMFKYTTNSGGSFVTMSFIGIIDSDSILVYNSGTKNTQVLTKSDLQNNVISFVTEYVEEIT